MSTPVETTTLTLPQLAADVSALDPNGSLRGISYARSDSNVLAPRWWTFIPYGTTWGQVPPQSPLEQVLQDALAPLDVRGRCFIDVLDLDNDASSPPDGELTFFADAPAGFTSVADAIAAKVDQCPAGVTPVVRYLTGRGPNSSGLVGFARDLCAAPVKNPDALLYYCNFTPPVLEPGTADRHDAAAAGLDLWRLIMDAVADLDDALHRLLQVITEDTLLVWIDRFIAAHQQTSGSWNHAKILAANGSVLVTGGHNFWTDYTSGRSWLVDVGLTVGGDAATDAQHFVDSLWTYANAQPPGSPLAPQVTALDVPVPDFRDGRAPLFAGSENAPMGVDPYGTVGVLTIADTGMAEVEGVRFSALLVDGVRDLLLNLVALMDVQQPGSSGIATATLLGGPLSDPSPAFQRVLARLGVSPANWASRAARNTAVRSAADSVLLGQQKLIMNDLYAGSADFRELVADINAELGLHGSGAWDGFLRPWDLFAALGSALCRTDRSAQPDAGVRVIGSTSYTPCNGYEDPVVMPSLLGDLSVLLDGLRSCQQVQFDGDAADLVRRRLSYRRIDDPAVTPADHAIHAKIVIVDDALMYVGSHNAYPSYNDEFGVWLGDRSAIQDFVDDVWQQLWRNAHPRCWTND